MNSAKMNILVSRTDRLGDVLLSLPGLIYLRGALPNAKIDFHCNERLKNVLIDFLKDYDIGYAPSITSQSQLKDYQAVLFFHHDKQLLKLAWEAEVPFRVGSYSKLASFWTLTQGMRQSRSKAFRNEGEYCLDLVKRFLKKLEIRPPAFVIPPIELPLNEKAKQLAQKILKETNLSAQDAYVVLHPGMGGSALNLNSQSYFELIKAIDEPVLISVGPSQTDRALAEELNHLAPHITQIKNQDLSVLMEIFRMARVVIAPSTGPLHLAHYVGAQTIGIFSPIRTQRPQRWGPWGGLGHAQNLSPQVQCRAHYNCLGQRCPHFPCMERAPWKDWIKSQLKSTSSISP